MNSFLRTIAVTLLAAALPSTFAAIPWTALEDIKPGRGVVVETRAEPNLRGKFVTVTEQALTLQVNGRVMELPRAEIVSVFEVRRKSLKKPLLIGIAIGAGAGAALGAAAGGCPPSDFVCWPRKVTIPVTAAAGAIAGAVFGSVAGLFRRERVLRYQAAGSRP